jgi:hypothetical protein
VTSTTNGSRISARRKRARLTARFNRAVVDLPNETDPAHKAAIRDLARLASEIRDVSLLEGARPQGRVRFVNGGIPAGGWGDLDRMKRENPAER